MIVSTDCPHCGTRKVAFNARFEFQVRHLQNEKYVLGTCNACREGVIFQLGLYDHTADVVLKDLIGDQSTLRMTILGQWPAAPENTAPADVPETVLRYFQQATDSLRARNFDAAGVMFRKTLEVATKERAPEARDQPLVKRIDLMADKGAITRDMREWAHEVRIGGNEAAHDEMPFNEKDADRLYKFANAFLQYAYTLPALVQTNKAKKKAGETVDA